MRIGFDVDGVLANFNQDYVELTRVLTKRDLFPPEWMEPTNIAPPTWYYPQSFGYTNEECDKVFEVIAASDRFWRDLQPYEGVVENMNKFYMQHACDNDVYFITNRAGKGAKWQTEAWLCEALGWTDCTVLVSSAKGLCAKALKLDVYLDDKWENALDVAKESPATRNYLLNQPYNVGFGTNLGVERVNTLEEFLRREGLINA